MCMTLVGKIKSIEGGKALVKSGSQEALVDLGMVFDVAPGDYVLFTAKQAIRSITKEEAKEIERLIKPLH